jgi:dipeptidyl aminopeptidase/acylaminoacyl peptidase
MRSWFFFTAAMTLASAIAARAETPLQAYAQEPSVASIALSPTGGHYALIQKSNGEDYFVVKSADGSMTGGAKTGEMKAERAFFIDENHVVLVAGKRTGRFGYEGEWNSSGAVVFDIATKKMKPLLTGAADIYEAQSGIGSVVGRSNDGEIFMPAFKGDRTYSLFSVELESGRARLAARGTFTTDDWLVREDGAIVARVDWDEEERRFTIASRLAGEAFTTIYRQENVDEPPLSVVGVAPKGDSLIVTRHDGGDEFYSLFELSQSGDISAPIFARDDRDVENVYTTINRRILGVRYSGVKPSYEFYDKSLDATMSSLVDYFGDKAVYLAGWSEDFSTILVEVSGAGSAPAVYRYERDSKTLAEILRTHDGLSNEAIGMSGVIEYKARDGKRIPSILTLPPGAELGQKLPAVVLPHGGPESYDTIAFDPLAQFLASRGYLVLQPNFRGSLGFGRSFREAGFGEWGGKMQDDISDGVAMLIKQGWVDPEKVCIVGGSYGGFAALAGGAYTPQLYKCVAAIAPVSDLPAMLAEERREAGRNSWVYRYWTRLIGDRKLDRARLDAVSPVNAAAKFTAPVLLLHGEDDDIVPIAHSEKMDKALKAAGKSVRLVRMQEAGHHLDTEQTRRQVFTELEMFLDAAIGE